MKLSQAKKIFWAGTLLSTLIFLILTYNSILQMPARTHEDNLTASVASGKWVWQKHNCNDCHTILGIGGYYAPDLTNVMGYRDSDWTKGFLQDPERVWPAKRKMPNLYLQDAEISDLVAFLTWVNGIDTNDWPPKPLVAAAAPVPEQARPGEALFKSLGCSACHMIGGVGGRVGPDLTREGGRRDREWIKEQIINPKSHDPKSVMPGFARLSKQDVQALVDYIAGLK